MLIISDRAAVIEFVGGLVVTRKVFYRIDTMYYLSPQIVEATKYDDYWIFNCQELETYKVYVETLDLTKPMLAALKRINLCPYIDNFTDITKYYKL